jgi:O-antigen/teichoic acid export membrane protein
MIIGWIATKNYRYFKKLNISLWKNFLAFGVPLVPAGFAIWIMQASDRWFVMKMLGSYELGIYAVGVKFAMLIALAVEVFRKAWWPIAMDLLHKPQASEFIKKISFWYILLGSIASVFLAIIAPYLVKYLVDKEYYESYKIIGVLSWSGIFYGFYLISELGIFKSKKTYYSILTNFIGAILNTVLNYFLIKLYGLIGAAYATIVSLMIANIVGMNISNKFLYVKWQWGWYGIFILISLSVIIYLGG